MSNEVRLSILKAYLQKNFTTNYTYNIMKHRGYYKNRRQFENDIRMLIGIHSKGGYIMKE